jgi:hypothetical protein
MCVWGAIVVKSVLWFAWVGTVAATNLKHKKSVKSNLHSDQLKKIRIHWSLVYLRSVVLRLLGGMLILTVLGASTFWIGQSFTSISLLFFSFSLCVTQGLSWALTAYINWANCSSLSQLLQGAYRSCAGLCVCACFFSPSWGMSDFEWPIIKTLLEYWSFPNLNGCRRQFDRY